MLKIFSREFASIGTLFTVQSLLFIIIGIVRARKVSLIFIQRHEDDAVELFTGSGEIVLLAGALALASHITLIVLLFHLTA